MDAPTLWRTLLLSDAPTLIYGPLWEEARRSCSVTCSLPTGEGDVDLRPFDLPRSKTALRLEMIRRWDEEPVLVLILDDSLDDQVRPVVFEACRRAYNVSASSVRRFDKSHKLLAFTSADRVPSEMAELFPIRIPAARAVARHAPRSDKRPR